MPEDDIKKITEQLRKLRIQQEQLRLQEVDLVEALVVAATKTNKRGRDKRSPSQGSLPTKADDGHDKFETGARVRILNPKPRKSGLPLVEGDKQGKVTRKTKVFIFVETDNELNFKEIRRSRTNLRLLN